MPPSRPIKSGPGQTEPLRAGKALTRFLLVLILTYALIVNAAPIPESDQPFPKGSAARKSGTWLSALPGSWNQP